MAGCGNETLYETGDTVCLYVREPVAPDSTYHWTNDGDSLEAAPSVTGADQRVLRIAAAETSDTAFHACSYDDGTKARREFGAHIIVGTSLPVFGSLSAGATVAAAGLGTRRVLRRR